MNAPNFMEFMQLLQGGNPPMQNNMFGNPFMSPNYIMNNNNNANMNMNLLNMMIQMMGLNGANIDNLMQIFNPPMPVQPNFNDMQMNKGNILNLIFMQRQKGIRITIQTNYKESISSLVNKYINKSGDANINIYIVNGRRLDESKTVAQSGLVDNSHVDVISVDDVEGAV